MARREGLGSLALAARGGSGRGREGSVGSLQWGQWMAGLPRPRSGGSDEGKKRETGDGRQETGYRGHGVAAVTRVKKGRRETGDRRRVTAATEWRR